MVYRLSKKEVNERDKPFIIALCFVFAFIGLIFLGGAGVLAGNVAIEEYVKQLIGNITGIVGTVVAFYFGTKRKTG